MRHLTETGGVSSLMTDSPPLDMFAQNGTTFFPHCSTRITTVEVQQWKHNSVSCPLTKTLDQGFYPEGVLTALSDEALVRDIEISEAAGFNGARLHQKVFEERFLYHADHVNRWLDRDTSVPWDGQPYLVSEFGGTWWSDENVSGSGSWGYGWRAPEIGRRVLRALSRPLQHAAGQPWGGRLLLHPVD